jgi:hypothetical protein
MIDTSVVKTDFTGDLFYEFGDLELFTNYSFVVIASNNGIVNSPSSHPEEHQTQTLGRWHNCT